MENLEKAQQKWLEQVDEMVRQGKHFISTEALNSSGRTLRRAQGKLRTDKRAQDRAEKQARAAKANKPGSETGLFRAIGKNFKPQRTPLPERILKTNGQLTDGDQETMEEYRKAMIKKTTISTEEGLLTPSQKQGSHQKNETGMG